MIETAPSVDKGRILISIVATNNSFQEEVKLNNRRTDTLQQTSCISASFQNMILKAEMTAAAHAQSRGRDTARPV